MFDVEFREEKNMLHSELLQGAKNFLNFLHLWRLVKGDEDPVTFVGELLGFWQMQY